MKWVERRLKFIGFHGIVIVLWHGARKSIYIKCEMPTKLTIVYQQVCYISK